MTTLAKTYATEIAARRAVEALRAAGVAERDIRLLVGSAPRDLHGVGVDRAAGELHQGPAILLVDLREIAANEAHARLEQLGRAA
jgi:hypothetical protein